MNGDKKTKERLHQSALKMGGLLSVAKFLVENGQEDLATDVMSPIINERHAAFDRECREAGYEGAEDFTEREMGEGI